MNGILPIYPAYHSDLVQASHYIHIALDRMLHTPCATKEDVEKLIEIYSDLSDFMEKIEKREENEA